jgi:hypothetical protein
LAIYLFKQNAVIWWNKLFYWDAMSDTLKSILISAVFLVTSCVSKENSTTTRFLAGKRLSELKAKKLREVSGLASSARNPGLLWAHNDSGHGAEVFLIDDKCDIKQSFILAGIENRDWEDIAVGPGPDSTKTYVYVGEIGDNDGTYALKYIYRFEEPLTDSSGETQTIRDFETITFRLPNGRRTDTEALFVEDQTKDLYVVTKREQPVHVYQIKYPYSTEDTLDAQETAALPLTQIVAADLSSDGHDLIMKNYYHIYYWNNSEGRPLSELLKERPEEIPYEPEPQGESLTWARDNSGFYTISEASKGQKSFLYFYGRR